MFSSSTAAKFTLVQHGGTRPSRRKTGDRVVRLLKSERNVCRLTAKVGGGGGEGTGRKAHAYTTTVAAARKRHKKKTGEKAAVSVRYGRGCCGGSGSGGDVTPGGLVPLACGTPHWLSAKHTAPSDRRRHRHRHRQTGGAADARALTYIPLKRPPHVLLLVTPAPSS